MKDKLRLVIIVTALAATILGLGGCRKKVATPTPTTSQQSLPLAGDSSSPLPTPNTATSPVSP